MSVVQLSIGQKIDSDQSASMENIHFGEGRRGGDGVDGSAEAPPITRMRMTMGGTRRRISEPTAPPFLLEAGVKPTLDHLLEYESSPSVQNFKPLPVLGTSCSAEGIAQLAEGGDWPADG